MGQIKAPIIINNNIININNYNFLNIGDKSMSNMKDININSNDYNDSFIKKNNLLIPLNGMIPENFLKEEQCSYVRKLSNFNSTKTLLKGYKRSSSAMNIREKYMKNLIKKNV